MPQRVQVQQRAYTMAEAYSAMHRTPSVPAEEAAFAPCRSREAEPGRRSGPAHRPARTVTLSLPVVTDRAP